MPEDGALFQGNIPSNGSDTGAEADMRSVSYTFPKRMYLLSSACALYSSRDRSELLLTVVRSGKKQIFYSASGKTEAEIVFERNEAAITFSSGVETLRFENGSVAFGSNSAYEAVYTCSGREYPIILKNGRVEAEFCPVPEDKNACGALVASHDEVAEVTAVYCALERLWDQTGFTDTRF